MTNTAPAKSPEQVWHRPRWQEYKDSVSLSRREDDARQLSRLFNAAAKSPTAKAALDWAAAHGIEIVVDRGLRGMNGGYHTGAGVLALSDDILGGDSLEQAVSTLTHELRHAWQDWHGMGEGSEGPASLGFTKAYMLTSLIEADATAVGALARLEYRLANDIERLGGNVDEGKKVNNLLAEAEAALKEANANPAAVMWEAFKGWYDDTKPLSYGVMKLHQRATELGETGVAATIDRITGGHAGEKTEFMHFSDPALPPLALGTPLELQKGAEGIAVLGRDFSGNGNYFGAGAREFFDKVALNADAARGLHGHARDRELAYLDISGMVDKVEKAEADAELRAREAKARAERDAGLEARRLEREKNRRNRPSDRTPRVTF